MQVTQSHPAFRMMNNALERAANAEIEASKQDDDFMRHYWAKAANDSMEVALQAEAFLKNRGLL